jgi:hypothetical protein
MAPRGAVAVLGIALWACGSAPLVPSGIAELVLHEDARALTRMRTAEEASGALEQRRAVLADASAQVLMPVPPDALVPELFDVLVALAPRMEAGGVSPAWASYVFTSYERDLRAERPTGAPRRTPTEVDGAVQGYVEFYRLHAGETRRSPTLEDAGFQGMQDWRNENRIGR